MNKLLSIFAPIILVITFILSGSVFIVYEWETAIRFQFGQIQNTYQKPGLYFKIPLIQNITKFDQRIQTLETQRELFLTFEKKNLLVDTFVKWKINDPRLYYAAVQGSIATTNARLEQNIKDGLRSEFGQKTLQEVVAGFNPTSKQTIRQEIQNTIVASAKIYGKDLGIDIIDVKIKGVELPDEVTENVFTRMKTERDRIAREFRARGEASYIETVAKADKKRTVMLAEAYSKAEIIRGDGDEKAANIFAASYGQDQDFFEFYRSLQAYRNTLKDKSDFLILRADSPFFKYLQSQ
ncbi:protein HflC [Gammaproteobacteria bacterium]|nr:protein HflC [Gammaproteobacteria bacterium]